MCFIELGTPVDLTIRQYFQVVSSDLDKAAAGGAKPTDKQPIAHLSTQEEAPYRRTTV